MVHDLLNERLLQLEEHSREIPGWLHVADVVVLGVMSTCQREMDDVGDVLEIGTYLGRSAIVLGGLLSNNERLYACDPFADRPWGEGVAAWDVSPERRQAAFEDNYRRFHVEPVEVLRCRSDQLPEATLSGIRLVHIDGAHDSPTVAADLRLSRRILTPGGIVVIDDYRDVESPGVAAATWAAVAADGLIPLCLTPNKMFAAWQLRHWEVNALSRRLVDLQLAAHVDHGAISRPVVLARE